MKNFEAWEACRAGRIDREAPGSNVIQLDLNAFRLRNSNQVLVRDFIPKLQALLAQFETTHETDSPWVPVMELPAQILTFRTVLALARVGAHQNREPVDVNKPGVEIRPLDVDSAEDCQEPINVPAEVDAAPLPEQVALEENLRNQQKQPALELHDPVAFTARNEANVLALRVLTDYYNNQLASYDEIEARIRLSPVQEVTRKAIFEASPRWEPIASAVGVLSWPANGGIRHKLPLESPIGLIANIHSLNELEGKYTARISVKNIPKMRNFEIIDECVRMTDRTLSVEVLTSDIFARLTLAWSLNLPVNIAVGVEKCINRGSSATFTVIQAFCPPQQDRYEGQTHRLAEELFNQPEEMGLWDPE